MESHKILVCGDIGGNFQTLFKRVATVNKSNGPFELLLCVGSFFEPFQQQQQHQHQHQQNTGSNENDENGENNDNVEKQNENENDDNNNNNDNQSIEFPKDLQQYKDGTETVPIPTYFIAYTSTDLKYINKFSNENGEICKGITYLGKSGIKNIYNLNIAYLSGKVDYPIKDHSNDKMVILKSEIDNIIKEAGDKRIDILLSNQWSRGVLNNVQSGIPTFLKQPYKLGMDGIKMVAQSICPAYHFSKNSFYFQRSPYYNNSNGNQSTTTRFLSLAPIYNDKKEKYLFAMSYQPNKEVNKDDITPNPFERRQQPQQHHQQDDQQHASKKQRNTNDSSTNFFFNNTGNNNNNNNNNNNSNNNKKRTQQNRQQQQQQQQNVDINCWFCLSSPEVDSHLVVTISNECYLAFPKGGMVDKHLLIVYTEHKPNFISLSKEERDDVNLMIHCLREYFKQFDMDIVIFERNVHLKGVVNHGHLQVIPIPKDITSSQVKDKFIKQSQQSQQQMEFHDIKVTGEGNDENEILDKLLIDQLYFLVWLPNGEKMYTILPPKSDFQFGRRVMTDLLNIPQKLNWKDCVIPKEDETLITNKFRDDFQPFFDKMQPDNNDE